MGCEGKAAGAMSADSTTATVGMSSATSALDCDSALALALSTTLLA